MVYLLLLVAIGAITFAFGVVSSENALRRKLMEDFTALNAAIAKLQADVNTLIAAKTQNNQAAIDAATTAVNAVDATVLAATPPQP